MTLIISVLTDQYVALISDRRTTWTQGAKLKRQEDTDVKTFNLFGQFIMGFTGLARIDDLRMEAWVSQILTNVPQEAYFETLRREIDAAFHRLGHSGRMPHAFLACGYAALKPGGRAYPMQIVVSNSIDSAGKFSADAVSPTFSVYFDVLGNRRRAITSVGWSMRETTVRALDHRIRVVTKGDPSNPRLAVTPLVLALRDTARHSNNYVGRSALFTSLPRSAVPAPGVTVGEVDFRQSAAAVYLPEDVRGPDGSIFYAPACISPQMHIFGLRVYSGQPSCALGTEEGYMSRDKKI